MAYVQLMGLVGLVSLVAVSGLKLYRGAVTEKYECMGASVRQWGAGVAGSCRGAAAPKAAPGLQPVALAVEGGAGRRLSPVGQAVVDALEEGHRGWRFKTWSVSHDNELPDDWLIETWPAADRQLSDRCTAGDRREGSSGGACDTELGLWSCSEQSDCSEGRCTTFGATDPDHPSSYCIGSGDRFLAETYNAIAGARESVVLSTLSSPGRRYGAVISRALARLNAAGSPVEARILIGQARDLESVLREVTRDIPDDDLHLEVAIGTYGGPPFSFNHSKILSVDGREALVGGRNLMDARYGGAEVHDLVMHVRGSAARDAERYFNELWDYAVESGEVIKRGSLGAAPAPAPLARRSPGNVAIIGAGSLGGLPFNFLSDSAGDTALLALIDAADHRLRISQQDLVSMPMRLRESDLDWIPRKIRQRLFESLPYKEVPQHLSPELLDRLGSAILRGVKVDIMLSDFAGKRDREAYGYWPIEKTAGAIADHTRENWEELRRAALERRGDAALPRSLEEVEALLQDNLRVTGFRASGPGELPRPAYNHTKLVIADEAAFYLGAQNLYPGSLSDTVITQLAEYGYIVDDEDATADLLKTYWGPMWWRSRDGVVPLP